MRYLENVIWLLEQSKYILVKFFTFLKRTAMEKLIGNNQQNVYF